MFKGRKAFGSVLAAVLITAAVIACVVVASGAAFKVLTLGTRQPTASLEALKAVHAAVEEVAFKPGATATVKIVTDEPITIGPDAIRLNTPLTEPPSLPDPKGIVKSVDRYGLTYENVRFTENRGFYGLATLTLICLKVEQGTAVIGYEPTGTVTAQLNALRIAVTTIGPGEGGTTSPQPGTYFYTAGSNVGVNVEAYANQGYRFKHWLLDGSVAGTASSITVTVNGDHVLEAVFVKLWTLSISVQPEGWGTTNPAPGTYTYEHGSQVAVTAIPYATYYFKEWILDGASSGSQNPVTVTMDRDHSLTAVFDKQKALTISVTPSGAGSTNPAPGTYYYVPGSRVTVTATPSQGYRFDRWTLDGSNAGTQPSITILMDSDHALTAVFVKQYALTVTAGQGGSVVVEGTRVTGTQTLLFDAGRHVTLTAHPDQGYRLLKWVVDGSDAGGGTSITVTMDKDHAVQAVFVRQYRLTIRTGGGGHTDPHPGTYTYDAGTTVTVTATPNVGYRFKYWKLDGNVRNENPISVTMNSDHDLEAVFVKLWTLTVEASSGGTTDPAPGTYVYEDGSTATVRAIPSQGWSLKGWTLDGREAGSQNPISVTMDRDHALKAVFQEYVDLHSLLGGEANRILQSFDVVEGKGYTAIIPSLSAYARQWPYYNGYQEVSVDGVKYTSGGFYGYVSKSGTNNYGTVTVEWSASAATGSRYQFGNYVDYATATVRATVTFKPSSTGIYLVLVPRDQANKYGGVPNARLVNGYYMLTVAGEATLLQPSYSQDSYAFWFFFPTLTASVNMEGGAVTVYVFKLQPKQTPEVQKLYSLLGSEANRILASYTVTGYEEVSSNVPSLYAYARAIPDKSYYYRYWGYRFASIYAEIRTPEGTFAQSNDPAYVSRSNTIRSGPISIDWSAQARAYKDYFYYYYEGVLIRSMAWYTTASVTASVQFKPSGQATYILVIPKSQADQLGGIQGAQVINGYYVLQVNGEKTIFNLASSQLNWGLWFYTDGGEASASTPGGPLNVHIFRLTPR